ncbi:hypothetical protein B296_00033586 [Ensete ventricosum]|uniref:Uncharacterized protein n=1 Tax=Ensete ventricosum TaxID=4639 RepID=A0A426XGV7_ENSVE|nr:hypothetical protein B296_00033586 [Ensete ventricosum]
MSLTGHLQMCCITANYSTTIHCTMSPLSDISIAFRFLCDELGLRSLNVWPLPAHHTASAISDFYSLPWQFTFAHPSRVTLKRSKDLNIIDFEAYTMASEEAIDAKIEAFENRMEEKMQSLFVEFSIGRPSSPRKSQHGETSDWRDDPQEHGHITSDLNNPCMKVDFPRWEEGDQIGWISRTKRYFRFYQTADASRVEIASIHLKGDATQWFN